MNNVLLVTHIVISIIKTPCAVPTARSLDTARSHALDNHSDSHIGRLEMCQLYERTATSQGARAAIRLQVTAEQKSKIVGHPIALTR